VSLLTENPRRTGPSAGHVQAQADELVLSAQARTTPRPIVQRVALRVNMERR
jgi:hypothetical protein